MGRISANGKNVCARVCRPRPVPEKKDDYDYDYVQIFALITQPVRPSDCHDVRL